VIAPQASYSGISGNPYFAFVDFATVEEAKAAMKVANGKTIAGGKLTVNYPKNESRRNVEDEVHPWTTENSE
jgi:hypothetical protein